ncbi:MAG TPA: rhodanese-related sulfurtransferase [Myxococcota bacterium]|nr:rhodanese-related sulfurtransferase [Myxococcota bacterium]
MIVVAALYRFTRISNVEETRSSLERLLQAGGVKGTVIIAEEGLNGTVAGERASIDVLRSFLQADQRFAGMEYKESFADVRPFKRLKVKVKNEIVTMGWDPIDPGAAAGTHVDAHTWNELLNDPKVTVIDVRNDFEVAMGSFKNAINPNTKKFSDFSHFVQRHLSPTNNKIIAMSCTGGIRCEKASSFLKAQGFPEVYQLKGGILQYLQDTPKDQSLWYGDCFVFDDRVALNHDLTPAHRTHRHGEPALLRGLYPSSWRAA